jgi:hypothetical protein
VGSAGIKENEMKMNQEDYDKIYQRVDWIFALVAAPYIVAIIIIIVFSLKGC